jgi:MoaA/NifB/PqqE/SkfB family radical SAM enzyme
MKIVHLVKNNSFENLKSIVIYLGDNCNFNCTYCDRDYINTIGGQKLNKKQSEQIKDFFEWCSEQKNQIKFVSFHGGEPFLFIKQMEEIMVWLYPMVKKNNWKIGITTNGSLIKKFEDFFIRYGDMLHITFSYDFMYQEKNRENLDIYSSTEIINKYCSSWQWQFVLPINEPSAFSFDNIKSIVNTCYKTNCRTVNIVPLRHKRGKEKFDVIIDEIDLPQFLEAFIQFIQILYIKKINVFIDGCYESIDKSYFSGHSKLILSPDGFIYPEFDFLEYKVESSRIGNWKNKQIWKDTGDSKKVYEICETCEKKPSCGLKYLYHLFEKNPKGNCKKFYTYMDYVIFHNHKIKEKKNLVHWIGITEDFEIKQ